MVPFAEKLVPQEVAPPLKEKVENTQRKKKRKKKVVYHQTPFIHQHHNLGWVTKLTEKRKSWWFLWGDLKHSRPTYTFLVYWPNSLISRN